MNRKSSVVSWWCFRMIFLPRYIHFQHIDSLISVQWEVARIQGGRCCATAPKGPGPSTYAILLWNLVLSRFTRYLKGLQRAFNESHPAFVELSAKDRSCTRAAVTERSGSSEGTCVCVKVPWQPQIACFTSIVKNNVFGAQICKYALYKNSEGLFCGHRKFYWSFIIIEVLCGN